MKKIAASLIIFILICLSACYTPSNDNQINASLISSTIQKDTASNQSKTSGNISESEHTHNFLAATCTVPSKCSCGLTRGESLGHDCLDETCTVPKKCKRCGITKGRALGHDYSFATCTSPKKCNRCGIVEEQPLGHIRTIGKCERCMEFFDLNVSLPTTPVICTSPFDSQIQINEVEYKIDEKGRIIITFSGKKVAGSESKIDFQYKLVDADEHVYVVGHWSEEGYSVGDEFKGKQLTLNNPGENKEYKFVIVNAN